ncbi:hypothetical protein ASE25_10530 [Terrabacter sp. Root85]|uniref:hypothetical protein n=1 Tax=Terrabacter sp. Root85 TaxID=1736603 RepID=UPI0006F95AC6|nr:hypothetical protein [Terrabacter sp. Root85]KRC89940.1 hypothetical protein ASE25_10530 [Terrabacter sp. Root85]
MGGESERADEPFAGPVDPSRDTRRPVTSDDGSGTPARDFADYVVSFVFVTWIALRLTEDQTTSLWSEWVPYLWGLGWIVLGFIMVLSRESVGRWLRHPTVPPALRVQGEHARPDQLGEPVINDGPGAPVLPHTGDRADPGHGEVRWPRMLLCLALTAPVLAVGHLEIGEHIENEFWWTALAGLWLSVGFIVVLELLLFLTGRVAYRLRHPTRRGAQGPRAEPYVPKHAVEGNSVSMDEDGLRWVNPRRTWRRRIRKS